MSPSTRAVPPGISSDLFRKVLGHLPTGVAVLTALTADGPTGMTANSVTSVSLDPPLILVCPAKSSATWPQIRHVRRFCVNIMASHHERACRQFAAKDEDRFRDITWQQRVGGPGIADAVAWIDVEIYNEHEAGDHTIVVARILDLQAAAEVDPLIFFRGHYGLFTAVRTNASHRARC